MLRSPSLFIQRLLINGHYLRRDYAWKRPVLTDEETLEQMKTTTSTTKKKKKYPKRDFITEKTLFVGNIRKSVTELEVAQLFSQVGSVTDVKKFDFAPFGWVTFEHLYQADRARRMFHGYNFEGCRLQVYEGQRTKRTQIPDVISTV